MVALFLLFVLLPLKLLCAKILAFDTRGTFLTYYKECMISKKKQNKKKKKKNNNNKTKQTRYNKQTQQRK